MRQIIVGISAVFLAAFLDLTDNTSVSVAFPSIASSLGASHAVLQWVSIGNTLALGAGLALGGQPRDHCVMRCGTHRDGLGDLPIHPRPDRVVDDSANFRDH